MPVKQKHDVVIVGSGPAGALTAYALARRGLDVLVIEKKGLPRYKTCGGGLTRRTLNILPFDVSSCIEDYSDTLVINVENRPVFEKKVCEPVIGMVMRDRFDAFLMDKAIQAGAKLQDKTAFESCHGPAGDLVVQTSSGTSRTRLIVGADGVSSKVSKALGFHVRKHLMTAMEAEVFYSGEGIVNSFKGSAHFDFGVVPSGYGWVFPKRRHLSIGIVSTSKNVGSLKHFFLNYMRGKGTLDGSEVRSLRTHLIPHGPDAANVLSDARGLLVGDAAGFSDPLTGEGIFFAVKGAQIASEVILNCLASSQSGKRQADLTEYSRILKSELMSDSIIAKRMAFVLYNFKRIGNNSLTKYGDFLGNRLLEVACGSKTYTELRKANFNLPSVASFFFHKLQSMISQPGA